MKKNTKFLIIIGIILLLVFGGIIILNLSSEKDRSQEGEGVETTAELQQIIENAIKNELNSVG